MKVARCGARLSSSSPPDIQWNQRDARVTCVFGYTIKTVVGHRGDAIIGTLVRRARHSERISIYMLMGMRFLVVHVWGAHLGTIENDIFNSSSSACYVTELGKKNPDTI